eukprot:3542327-Lingulodinium_polyedra.AAC.1
MVRAGVRLASRCDGARSTRSHHCATLHKRCAMMRSSRRFAPATARELHTRTLHAHANCWRAHGVQSGLE